MKEAEEKLSELAESVADSLGVEILDLRFVPRKSRLQIRITIDRVDHPVTISDCVKLTRQLSRILDVEDPISGAYNLDVSSPGFRRIIRIPRDLNRFVNKKVKVKLTEPISEQTVWIGRLQNDSDPLKLATSEAGNLEIAFNKIKQLNLHE